MNIYNIDQIQPVCLPRHILKTYEEFIAGLIPVYTIQEANSYTDNLAKLISRAAELTTDLDTLSIIDGMLENLRLAHLNYVDALMPAEC